MSDRNRERRYRDIIESAVDFAIIATETDGVITDWNTGAEKVLGWSAHEICGQTLDRFFTPEDRAADRPAIEMKLALADGRAADERWRMRKDGSRFWASGEMMPLTDDDGAHLGFIKILRDRTEQQDAAAAHLADAEFLRSVLASSADCIKVLDLDGNLAFMNEGGLKVMEVSDFNAIKGCPWPQFWEREGNIHAVAALESARAGKPARFRGEAATMKGTAKSWDVQVTPILGKDGTTARILSVSRDVTETEQIDAAARRLVTLVEQSADFIGEAALDGSVSQINPAGMAMVGLFDPAAVKATRIAEYFTPAVRKAFESVAVPAIRSAGSWEGDLAFRHFQTGEAIPIFANIFPLRDASGAITSYGAVARDQRERQRADRFRYALADIGDHLREVDDLIAMQVSVCARIGEALGADRVGFGAVAEDRETFTVRGDWTAPECPTLAGTYSIDDYGLYADDLRAGSTVVIDDIRKDLRTSGNPDPLAAVSVGSLVNHPVMEHGQIAAILYVNDRDPREWRGDEVAFVREAADRLRQASERRRAEIELRALNARLESEVEARTADRNRLWAMSADLMLIATLEGTINAVNPAWERVLGWSDDALIGTSLFDLIHPDDLTHTIEGAADIGAGRSLTRFENRYRTSSGDYRHISWTAGPADGLIVAVGRDTTSEKEKAEALAAAEEQLRQSQKMEAVGQLTGGLAHDFNNLLTGITGSLEMIAMRLKQGRMGDVEKYSAAAQGAAKRAAALTHRLLAFSRRQTLDPKPTSPRALVEGMLDLIRRTAGPAVETRFVSEADLWTTLVDPNQLENALLNLSINARDAMPEGGTLVIEASNATLDARLARRYELDAGSYLSICVSDTGTGMPADVVSKAFDPFFTTKPLGVGTGLGLSMIYGFARQSGGAVHIQSKEREGTRVCIFLPRHRGAAEAENEEAQLNTAPSAEIGETVLVVDDEPSIRMLVTDVLEELGYRAIEAADGASGLQILQSDARIDLLVSDVGLPGGMNGRQMADAARVGRPDLKVLFITGYAQNAAVGGEDLDTGMHVMTKPFAMEALATRIRTLIEDRSQPERG